MASQVYLPRWLALVSGFFVWLVVIPLIHCGLPWAISLLTPRYDWINGAPGVLSLLGLIPVVLGIMCLIWIMTLGFSQTPEKVKLEWNSTFLLRRGPYALSRNPMYVAELGLWLGWSIFYGSIAVFMAFVVLCLVVNFIILPREERALEARFGDVFREYKETVPRWFGKIRR